MVGVGVIVVVFDGVGVLDDVTVTVCDGVAVVVGVDVGVPPGVSDGVTVCDTV